jgi:hypothetical protein
MLKEIQAQPEKLFEIIRVDIRALLNGSLRSLISPGLIKRRIKSTEIVACENACYTLRAFFCLKMEPHWRSNPIGSVHKNLPIFQKLTYSNFAKEIDSALLG